LLLCSAAFVAPAAAITLPECNNTDFVVVARDTILLEQGAGMKINGNLIVQSANGLIEVGRFNVINGTITANRLRLGNDADVDVCEANVFLGAPAASVCGVITTPITVPTCVAPGRFVAPQVDGCVTSAPDLFVPAGGMATLVDGDCRKLINLGVGSVLNVSGTINVRQIQASNGSQILAQGGPAVVNILQGFISGSGIVTDGITFNARGIAGNAVNLGVGSQFINTLFNVPVGGVHIKSNSSLVGNTEILGRLVVIEPTTTDGCQIEISKECSVAGTAAPFAVGFSGTVTNTGTTDVMVNADNVSDQAINPPCPAATPCAVSGFPVTLAPGQSFDYADSYQSNSSANMDTVTASGTTAGGATCTAKATAECAAPLTPAIRVEKECEDATGFGEPITFTATVTNTGNVTLTDVTVVDDPPATVSCPQTTLAPGESMECTGSYTPVGSGEFTDTVTATGTFGMTQVMAEASATCEVPPPSPAIRVEKECEDATGFGEPITFTATVTNTGNVTLTDVTVVDDPPATVSCPQTTLAPGESMECTGSYTPVGAGEFTDTVTATGTVGMTQVTAEASATCVVPAAQPAVFLVIDEDSIDNGIAPNFFSATDVNDQIAAIGLRLQLAFFAANPGMTIVLHTGSVGDEGWFAPKTIPASWVAAGPTSDGVQNFLTPGPGLGAPPDPESLLDKIPDVTPLRATGLELLEGRQVCAVVYDSDISINYNPLDGSLKGANLGIVAFEVISVDQFIGGSSGSLPTVTLKILDADEVCAGPLTLFTEAPAPTSSSEPFDIDPDP
jgi:uncharacterized repeat protein (TIGR01451 family)